MKPGQPATAFPMIFIFNSVKETTCTRRVQGGDYTNRMYPDLVYVIVFAQRLLRLPAVIQLHADATERHHLPESQAAGHRPPVSLDQLLLKVQAGRRPSAG